jgi:hypothetical protein
MAADRVSSIAFRIAILLVAALPPLAAGFLMPLLRLLIVR